MDESDMAQVIVNLLEIFDPDVDLPGIESVGDDSINGRVNVRMDDGSAFLIRVERA